MWQKRELLLLGFLVSLFLFSSQKSQGGVLFAPVKSYPSGGEVFQSVAVADINRDGKPDLIVSNSCIDNICSAGNVAVLIGNGDGTFQSAQTYLSGGVYAWSVAVADVNHDGWPDLFIANGCLDNSCVYGSVAVLLNNGDGTFKSAITYNSGGNGATAIAVADVNGDGIADVVVANNCFFSDNCNNGGAAVLLGNPDGSFQAATLYASGGYTARALAIRDLNGDGKADLIVANECVSKAACGAGTLGVLFGNGDGTFQAPQVYSPGGITPVSIALADVNGDGNTDVLVANQYLDVSQTHGGVGVLLGNGNGTFHSAQSYATGVHFASSVAVGDINGDGKLDLLVAGGCSALNSLAPICGVGVLLGNGDGTFQLPQGYSSGGFGPDSVAVEDVNGDARPDVIVSNACALGRNCRAGTLGVLLAK